MTENNHDLIENNELSKNANGGTELMLRKIYDGFIPRETLEQFQIIPSRVRDLKEDKWRVYIVNDLPGDPEVTKVLENEGWRKFHSIVFVSHWQAQRFVELYNIPWSKTVVMLNAIDPIESIPKPTDKINIIYHTTPHRGLNILLSVWDALCAKHSDIHLDVYSSFSLYGWPQRDEQFKDLFSYCQTHPRITYHGAVDNNQVRTALQSAHIFAYPSIWQETSCLCLMEAMSAQLDCIHPDYAALPETAANWTSMYRWNENIEQHANIFATVLDASINMIRDKNDGLATKLHSQKIYADIFYNWLSRRQVWNAFLQSIVSRNEPKEIPAEQFVYKG